MQWAGGGRISNLFNRRKAYLSLLLQIFNTSHGDQRQEITTSIQQYENNVNKKEYNENNIYAAF